MNSAPEDKKQNQTNNAVSSTQVAATTPEAPKLTNPVAEKENTDTNKQDSLSESYKERKKLKKRRKDKLKKLLFKDDKSKKKKHRCFDENCKHRKHHKKHRKHRKHHHRSENETSSNMENDMQVEESESKTESFEMEQEEDYDDVSGSIIEETNIVHKKILESKAKV